MQKSLYSWQQGVTTIFNLIDLPCLKKGQRRISASIAALVLALFVDRPAAFAAGPIAAKVWVFLSMKCPCSQSHLPKLKKLSEKYRDLGVEFVGVHSNADEDSVLAKQYFDSQNLGFQVVEDSDLNLLQRFGAIKTPHAFVELTGAANQVVYSGGIDDSSVASQAHEEFLDQVLEAVVNKKSVPFEKKRALGCQILRSKRNGS